jgi:signal transduction histidine kinase
VWEDLPHASMGNDSRRTALEYAAAVAAVGIATAGTIAIQGVMGASVSILFFPAVLFAAIYGGYGPSLLATVLSTATLAYFFVRPYWSFDIGADDVVRLGAFALVGLVTASISSARKRAEDAQRQALIELRGALATLQKVSGWPVFVDVTIAGAAAKLLAHAAAVVQCTQVVAIWEAEDEPWVYVASSDIAQGQIVKIPPTEISDPVPPELRHASFVSNDPVGLSMQAVVSGVPELTTWRGPLAAAQIYARLRGRGLAAAPFEGEHLQGRMFCAGFTAAGAELVPLVDVVAHEVGSSLERLHLHDQLQQVAIREERIRVARDLHDGVLQSLTGIRLRLQALADTADAPAATRDNLLAVERAIAIEQRELRLFIEDLKPLSRQAGAAGSVGNLLQDIRDRLELEWSTPILVRTVPPDLRVPAAVEQTLRLLVREAIVNALKHAQPSRVSVDIERVDPATLRVAVVNDGRGFPFHGRRTHDELQAINAGPVSLRERLMSVGGSLTIESRATGSRVEMSLPV